MRLWQSAALTGAFVIAVAGPRVTSVVQAQNQERAPYARAFEFIGGGTQIGVRFATKSAMIGSPSAARIRAMLICAS